MAEKIKLEVVTPDRLVVSEMVDIVVATGSEGEFGVLYNHIPFLSTLAPGELRYRIDSTQHLLAVTSGFAEVLPDKVTILAEAAEMARDIDISRAQKARERAQERLAKAKTEEMDHIRAEAALRRAMVRIKVAEKVGSA